MGLIEDAVEQLRRDHIRDAPRTMQAALLTEFVAVVNLTEQRQTARIRIRLAGAAAQLATFAADSLMKLGETPRSEMRATGAGVWIVFPRPISSPRIDRS